MSIREDLVSASEAAKILSVDRSRVGILCRQGRFDGAAKIGSTWMIPRVAVENFKRLKPGVKPKSPDDKAVWLEALAKADNLKGEEIS